MRLIDADALIERIKIHKKNVMNGSDMTNVFYGLAHDHIMDVIEIQPTAYDVDAVVARLKEKQDNVEHLWDEAWKNGDVDKINIYNYGRCCYAAAIVKVRKGGIGE